MADRVLESSGSSPLARGLLPATIVLVTHCGIIPARAGFTNSSPLFRVSDGGSSPLARGLQFQLNRDGVADRIIPARAGFTLSPATRSTGHGDHPRSRGVYHTMQPSVLNPSGSSPLARGLLRGNMIGSSQPGIIPARAGFTSAHFRPQQHSRDHPRSRGVYSRIRRLRFGVRGSSPLARGLPIGAVRHAGWPGIIPARAGFTWIKDHMPVVSGWIIPARAGFTSKTVPIVMLLSDHPRSRGVYSDGPRLLVTIAGSSPLARGLQTHISYSSL